SPDVRTRLPGCMGRFQRVLHSSSMGPAPGGDAVASHGGVEPEGRRRNPYSCRRLSTYPLERSMPDTLPQPAGVPDDELARGKVRSPADGPVSRYVLPGLLLGAD